jgi:hypothetical protein
LAGSDAPAVGRIAPVHWRGALCDILAYRNRAQASHDPGHFRKARALQRVQALDALNACDFAQFASAQKLMGSATERLGAIEEVNKNGHGH